MVSLSKVSCNNCRKGSIVGQDIINLRCCACPNRDSGRARKRGSNTTSKSIKCICSTVQPRLSKPLWPALKSGCSNEQKLRVYICCTINHAHSHKLQCIVTDFLSSLMALSFDVSFLAENSSSFTLYTTFLNAISAPVIHTNIANDGCTALYFACTYQYHGQCLYFDPHFCMALKFG